MSSAPGSKRNIVVPVLAVLVVVAGVGGFFGGMQYQKSKQPAAPSFGDRGSMNFNGNINRGRTVGNIGGGMVRGTVTAVQGSTITVQDTSGSSKLVITGSSTTVENTVSASLSDVAVGTSVMASGTSNSDGSVTATTIQLNPSTGGLGIPPTTMN